MLNNSDDFVWFLLRDDLKEDNVGDCCKSGVRAFHLRIAVGRNEHRYYSLLA
ncbi:hypothetical protein DPMN_074243 [Dreissena polymorpha]|uniref:Uncharacterized protein n=1 Tax=Dreissena polymorpha TaxID=45954 RepID=A0A9D4BLE1_DREPO|nr:hypothetical protein DPMN_074243 [Dreissena polymorpha]